MFSVSPEIYTVLSQASRWLFILLALVLLFLAWGWLMYRLWVWIDSRGTRKNGEKHDR